MLTKLIGLAKCGMGHHSCSSGDVVEGGNVHLSRCVHCGTPMRQTVLGTWIEDPWPEARAYLVGGRDPAAAHVAARRPSVG